MHADILSGELSKNQEFLPFMNIQFNKSSNAQFHESWIINQAIHEK